MAFVNALSLEGAVVEWKVSGDTEWSSSDEALPAGYGTLEVGASAVRAVNGDATVSNQLKIRVRVPALLSAAGGRVTVTAADMDADSGGQDNIVAELYSTGQADPDFTEPMANHLQSGGSDPLVIEDVDPNPAEFEAFEVTGEEGGSVGAILETSNS